MQTLLVRLYSRMYVSYISELNIVLVPGHEKAVLSEIEKIKKARKNLKRADSSFNSEKPRKAAMKQKEMMKSAKIEKTLKKVCGSSC